MTKVSIIIPTYNRAELLLEAVASVLRQTYHDFELIVIDDCSTDNTSNIIASFVDERLRYIRNCSNEGIAAVRNIGVLHSKGQYIAFLDDDDVWMPEKLEKQIKIIESGSEYLGLVYTECVSIDTSINKILKTTSAQFRGWVLKELLMNNFLVTSTVIIKKSCFNKVGLFDNGYSYAEDYDMWIRISKEYEFDFIKERLVTYQSHHDRLSTNISAKIQGLERLITKHEGLYNIYNKARSKNQFALGLEYNNNKNMNMARKYIIKAIRSYPYDLRYYYYLSIILLERRNNELPK